MIGVRLETLRALFESFDPAPMPDGDLGSDVAEYIVDRATDISSDCEFEVVLHLPAADVERARVMDLTQRIQTRFRARAEQERRHLADVFRSGRQALAIGLGVLAACLLLAWLIGNVNEAYASARLARESLVVIGWVAIWRPAEIFLYDWIPIEQRKKLLFRLAGSTVSVIDAGAN